MDNGLGANYKNFELLPQLFSSDNNNLRNPETELREGPLEMENTGGALSPSEPKKSEIRGVAELFRFAVRLDYALMGIDSVGAFVCGCSPDLQISGDHALQISGDHASCSDPRLIRTELI
ncbi:unnamed protein product [Brassica rapa subsp. trilocularis]